MSSLTIQDLRSFCDSISVDGTNCHAESRKLEDIIREEFGVTARVVTGVFVAHANDDTKDGTKHSWVQIPATDVADAVADVIIDPTVQQFTSRECGDHSIDTLTLTDTIGVYPSNSELGDHYRYTRL